MREEGERTKTLERREREVNEGGERTQELERKRRGGDER